mmetsp:Transcript_16842/g.25928  ORF Transcript_16842/g.25928 Transcript_16842/m.25928 type:complete len:93 (+) Transcript_16842:540-818(+)
METPFGERPVAFPSIDAASLNSNQKSRLKSFAKCREVKDRDSIFAKISLKPKLRLSEHRSPVRHDSIMAERAARKKAVLRRELEMLFLGKQP